MTDATDRAALIARLRLDAHHPGVAPATALQAADALAQSEREREILSNELLVLSTWRHDNANEIALLKMKLDELAAVIEAVKDWRDWRAFVIFPKPTRVNWEELDTILSRTYQTETTNDGGA